MEPDNCPKCGVSFQGEPIPEKSRQDGSYGNSTHFSRVIGIYSRGMDRTTQWRCPDCGHVWDR